MWQWEVSKVITGPLLVRLDLRSAVTSHTHHLTVSQLQQRHHPGPPSLRSETRNMSLLVVLHYSLPDMWALNVRDGVTRSPNTASPLHPPRLTGWTSHQPFPEATAEGSFRMSCCQDTQKWSTRTLIIFCEGFAVSCPSWRKPKLILKWNHESWAECLWAWSRTRVCAFDLLGGKTTAFRVLLSDRRTLDTDLMDIKMLSEIMRSSLFRHEELTE